MTNEEEDVIIAQAEAIESRIFHEAEKKWEEAPKTGKPRPWPRCGNITCNRTMLCRIESAEKCEGFDY